MRQFFANLGIAFVHGRMSFFFYEVISYLGLLLAESSDKVAADLDLGDYVNDD